MWWAASTACTRNGVWTKTSTHRAPASCWKRPNRTLKYTNDPRAALAARHPLKGGDASGPAKPVPPHPGDRHAAPTEAGFCDVVGGNLGRKRGCCVATFFT